MGTQENPVEIDETRFAGRRKYNRGRLLKGDKRADSTDSEADVENNRNHGRRIEGHGCLVLKMALIVAIFMLQEETELL